MIVYHTTNMFESSADILVNAVNLDGVMGAGLALEFKKKFPKMYDDYHEKCISSNSYSKTIDDIFVYEHGKNPKVIINFPTKYSVQRNSDYDLVRSCLIKLREFLIMNTYNSIAIPALGCGLGGLHWLIVRSMIEETLSIDILKSVDIMVYPPQ